MGLMISHGMLQDHDFQHFLGFGVRKFALGDEVFDMGGQGMDTLIRELEDVGNEFIPEVPEMFLKLYSGTDIIKGKLGHLLTPQGDGRIVDEGLESLSVFALENHLQLLPAHAQVISFISFIVEGFQVVTSPGIEDFPVL